MKPRLYFWFLFLTACTCLPLILFSEQIFQVYLIQTGALYNSGPSELNDLDHDGVLDSMDNCNYGHNPDQKDDNGNSVGDVCEYCYLNETDKNGGYIRLTRSDYEKMARENNLPAFQPFYKCFADNTEIKPEIPEHESCLSKLTADTKKQNNDSDQDGLVDECDDYITFLSKPIPPPELISKGHFLYSIPIQIAPEDTINATLKHVTDLEKDYTVVATKCEKLDSDFYCDFTFTVQFRENENSLPIEIGKKFQIMRKDKRIISILYIKKFPHMPSPLIIK